ncbi:MAG: type II toxin-antitoxin system RelE/ParE family toxin [Deltaproteobacteria bacterium]|nr:MAG: type II toxin-antitoxin system RelE/ParE family toxin [Deltaproteobacteria bacterium]
MADDRKIIKAKFYRSDTDKLPVREWLTKLPRGDQKIIGDDIRTVEFGWPIGMPLARPLGNRLWEVRSDLENGRTARILFTIHKNQMLLLHGFIKKSQKTSGKDMDIARKRMK